VSLQTRKWESQLWIPFRRSVHCNMTQLRSTSNRFAQSLQLLPTRRVTRLELRLLSFGLHSLRMNRIGWSRDSQPRITWQHAKMICYSLYLQVFWKSTLRKMKMMMSGDMLYRQHAAYRDFQSFLETIWWTQSSLMLLSISNLKIGNKSMLLSWLLGQ
jgi:hypothetical protein